MFSILVEGKSDRGGLWPGRYCLLNLNSHPRKGAWGLPWQASIVGGECLCVCMCVCACARGGGALGSAGREGVEQSVRGSKTWYGFAITSLGSGKLNQGVNHIFKTSAFQKRKIKALSAAPQGLDTSLSLSY
jgi:hypothetical protein